MQANTLFELLISILSDTVPDSDDTMPVYLVAGTQDNQESVFDVVRRREGQFPVWLSDGPTGFGYPGADEWVSVITSEYEVSQDRLVRIPHLDNPDGAYNTLTEIRSLVAYADEQSVNSVVLVAPSFHLVRVFLHGVGTIKEAESSLRIYALCGKTLPWNEVVVHSQGSVRGTRSELIGNEFQTISRWIGTCGMATLEQALEYLSTRDSV